jgi:hypothetical protein
MFLRLGGRFRERPELEVQLLIVLISNVRREHARALSRHTLNSKLESPSEIEARAEFHPERHLC